jgi:hypothetical protein
VAGIRDELRRIHDANGGKLTPQAVVQEAASPNSPLHNRFEWDDTVAGRKYRLIQAADLIREQRIEYARDKNGPKTVREWTSTYVSGDNTRGAYRRTEDVLADDMSAQILFRNFERELADLKRNYGHLKQFSTMLRKAAS